MEFEWMYGKPLYYLHPLKLENNMKYVVIYACFKICIIYDEIYNYWFNYLLHMYILLQIHVNVI